MALPDAESPASAGTHSHIIRAAAIVGAAFVVSRLLGIVRDAVINYYFGIASVEANAYFIASRFPETIFYIIAGGALGSAFIPTFAAYFVREDDSGGWHLFSAIINLITIVVTLVAGLAAVFAPQIIDLFYSDLMAETPQLLDVTVRLMRVMLLSPIIFGVSGVAMGALNARQHFLLPAVAPIVYNLGIILGTAIFAPNVMGLAYGTVAGALGHLLVQVPALIGKRARYSFVLSLRDPGVRQVLRLMAPRVLGLSFGQLNHLLIQFMAQSMVIGSIPALSLAWRIMIMPQGIIGQALAIAAFPTFATLAARSALDEMRRIVADTLRLILYFSLPAAVLLMLLRIPIIDLLFQRGQFDATATEFVAWALLFYALSLIGLAAIEIISRAFYALEDTLTPVLVGMLQLGSMWLLGYWLANVLFPALGWLALGALALGYTISTLLELVLLLWLLRRKMNGLEGWRLLDGLWRMGLATSIMAGITWLVFGQLAQAAALWQLLVAGLVGGLTYLGASALLRITELQQLLATLRRRLHR
ncbi:MAG: murein biosynthesis integral membrane protein MurJ [Chloroflexota bacterium]|jgi:putative peptidoglycan lipid II flippase